MRRLTGVNLRSLIRRYHTNYKGGDEPGTYSRDGQEAPGRSNSMEIGRYDPNRFLTRMQEDIEEFFK